MFAREIVAVHRVREQHVVAHRVGDGERSLVCDTRAHIRGSARVGADTEDFDRRPQRLGHLEHGAQRRAGPLRGAHGPGAPLLAGNGRIEERAPVAGALEGHHERPRWQRTDVVEVELQRRAYCAVDREAPRGFGYREVIADVMTRRGRDHAYLPFERSLRVQRLAAQVVELVRVHAASLWHRRRTSISGCHGDW